MFYLFKDTLGAPGKPAECTEFTEDSATITCYSPQKVEGNPMEDYMVEKMEKGDNRRAK